MPRLRAVLLAAMLMIPLQNATATDPKTGDYRIIGLGNESCGSWTDHRKSENGTLMDGQWVLGFLTAAGFFMSGANPLEGVDANAVLAWMDNYCAANPLTTVNRAAIDFYRVHPFG